MRKYIIILAFIAFCANIFAQSVTIMFKDSESNPIPYLTVFDSSSKINLATNLLGLVKLKKSSYNISTSHISFFDTTFKIEESSKDTLLTILLKNRSKVLNEVSIVSKLRINKSKYFEIGNFKRKTLYIDELNSNLKLGYWITPNFSSIESHYFRSFKIKILNFKELKKENFIVELKLYKINNKIVDSIPLNNKPIYLHSNELRKNNEILINENIIIPKDGFFISIELPPLFGKKETLTIRFVTDYSSETCRMFIQRNNNKSWNKNILFQPCKVFENNGNKKELMISITYFNLKQNEKN